MEVDFGLAGGPLTSEARQENYLSFHSFDIAFGVFGRRVVMAPDV